MVLPAPPSPSDGELLRSLHRLARDLSAAAETPAPFLRGALASITRRSKLLAAAFDDLVLCAATGDLPRSASLCLREVLFVLQRFKALATDCAARSRMRLLLHSDEIEEEVRELHQDLATLLDLLPVVELGLAEDVMDLLGLASRQCRRFAPSAQAEQALKARVLSLIQEIEREIVPDRERLQEILEEAGINDPPSCSKEIESLEREIGDRASERWTDAMIALVGRTPRSTKKGTPAPPPDFRCPITLDIMRDPVVVASGQTYDRDSISRWFDSGKSTCPKTGQVLTVLELVPNKALKNLIAKCAASRSEPAQAVAANKAALEAARMTASFLVKKLSISFSPDAANRVVHDIRLLSKSGADSRAFVGEAGAVPLLANKKRIMHAEGAVEAVAHIMSAGATLRAKENAAAAVLSLASVHTYRRRLGRNLSIVEKLVHLVRTGPTSTKKDALAALLSLAGERENVGKLVSAGVAQVALSAISEEETAAAVLAALAKRGGAEAIVGIDGAVARLVAEMRRGTEWARENATAALVLLCRRLGARVVMQVMAVPRGVGHLGADGHRNGAGASQGRVARQDMPPVGRRLGR
ncbi:U-box domain-containing protein 16 [Zea mays]|uniref:RING-type E3 ubiquitin transferase n=1 Tax=Zea mays TaxID=4577 RepID=A0A3L6DH39_MAIZE|nr:U-box domain-containing protein 16 [Zea mays]